MPHLLHGTLIATIYGIDRLQTGCGFNMFGKSPRRFLSEIKRTVLCRPELVGTKLYATVDLDKSRVARTRMVEKDPNTPTWNESFSISCAHPTTSVIFTIKNDELLGASLIGRAHLPAEDLIYGTELHRDLAIEDEGRNPTGSRIRVRLRFVRASEEPNWSAGLPGPAFGGVPRAFFNQRQGCRVTLYQDAHVPDGFDPRILLSGGEVYRPGRCWEDVLEAIVNAKHLIYVTGWSVFTEITLVRDGRRRRGYEGMKLGELLKRKADEGVAVLMLVWDDRTSVEEFKRDGLMATHDQETEEFFRNTNVHCFLCPRDPDDGKSLVQGFQVSTMFTHHQKTVVVDAEMPPGAVSQKRRIVSFLGGIDLCDGRYDTQDHPLFSSLDGAHLDDFHQPNFPGASLRKGGPREPWHDVHCRVEGPAAWDVLYNFEQRWRRQVSGQGSKLLIPLNRFDRFIVNPATPAAAVSPGGPDAWSVQLFRSIDGGAASGFPETPREAAAMGLVTGKDNVIDRSIQDAYVSAIRRAKSFVYIENQYFLGSSFGWKSSPDLRPEEVNALHLIPKELSLKIVSKIEAGERFAAYVVIPMWPEGIPESGSVQAILDWQRRTMEMMYTDIAQALQRKGLNDLEPRDFLSFFCLGNREERGNAAEYSPPERPDPGSDYSRAQQARRFMIYVHSKMMIVDDEYIIVGSANINQRSMDGARDSEIAMGAFQPHHLAAAGPARGQIYGFRMSLWLEHLGTLEDSFTRPGALECVRAVRQIAQENWELYHSDIDVDLQAHLLRYPVEVSRTGVVTALPGLGEFFPDTKAKVLGTKSDYLPPILTT